MKKFSFRVECIGDLCRYLAEVGGQFKIVECVIRQDQLFPDLDATLSIAADLQTLKSLARDVLDCHVIEESLEEGSGGAPYEGYSEALQ